MSHPSVSGALAAARGAVGALLRRPSTRGEVSTDQACPSCRCTGTCPTVEDVALGIFALTLGLDENPLNAWSHAPEDQRERYRARARFVLGFAGQAGDPLFGRCAAHTADPDAVVPGGCTCA